MLQAPPRARADRTTSHGPCPPHTEPATVSQRLSTRTSSEHCAEGHPVPDSGPAPFRTPGHGRSRRRAVRPHSCSTTRQRDGLYRALAHEVIKRRGRDAHMPTDTHEPDPALSDQPTREPASRTQHSRGLVNVQKMIHALASLFLCGIVGGRVGCRTVVHRWSGSPGDPFGLVVLGPPGVALDDLGEDRLVVAGLTRR